MAARDKQLGNLYKGLNLDFKSVPNEEAKCKVVFHNCTPYNVYPHWIDFNGSPLKYTVLKPKTSITMSTYACHLWFFRASSVAVDGEGQRQTKKIFAISSDSLDSQCNATNLNYKPMRVDRDTLEGQYRHICPLCRHIIQAYSRIPIMIPCHHLTGEAKLSSSDLSARSHSDYNTMGAYIYTCSEDTHRKDHSQRWRDLFLVESFYNLRERCLMKMSDELKEDEFLKLKLPTSIARDYIQFVSAERKLNE